MQHTRCVLTDIGRCSDSLKKFHGQRMWIQLSCVFITIAPMMIAPTPRIAITQNMRKYTRLVEIMTNTNNTHECNHAKSSTAVHGDAAS